MKTLHATKLLLPLLVSLMFISCKRNSQYSSVDCASYNYSDCNTTEPLEAGLNITLTINADNPRVPITIYQGKLEDNIIALTDTVTTTKYNVLLPPDYYYTVKARYLSGHNVIYAIGGDNVKKIKNLVCDSICWSTEDGYVNVELK